MQVVIENLSKTFRGGIHALSDVSIDIGSGMVGLLGSNGAGKTTLMRILCGVLPPSSGRVLLDNRDLSDRSAQRELKRRLGYLPQDLALYPDLTAQEFVEYVALLKGIPGKQRREQARRLLDLVGLTDVANRRVKGFSGGMRRRVGIAQALLGDPELLVVDEPTAGLDPEERVRFRSLLTSLGADRTVLLSTHILDDVAQTCPKLIVMDHGRVLYLGATSGLLDAVRGRTYLVYGPPELLGVNAVSADGDMVTVSTVSTARGTAHRVISSGQPAGAEPVEPTLEDAYTSLLREHRQNYSTGSVRG